MRVETETVALFGGQLTENSSEPEDDPPGDLEDTVDSELGYSEEEEQ